MASQFIYIFMLVLLFAARFVADKIIDTTSSKVRFGMGALLLVMYTVFIESYIYIIYHNNIMRVDAGLPEFYQSIIVGIALINFAVLFVAIVYYFMRKKRKISSMDKMKLKDL